MEVKSFGCLNEFEFHFLSNGALLDVPKMGVTIDGYGSVRFKRHCQCLLHLVARCS